MAKKEPDMNENTDREKDKRIEEDWKSHHTTQDRYPDEAKGIAETEVKNAHASGDGSFGRNDTGLTDDSEQETKTDNTY
ncbi:MAG TPA: hypothetical protein VGB71_07870 [Flavisolibacter sp.]|jgi:hypothetical protein